LNHFVEKTPPGTRSAWRRCAAGCRILACGIGWQRSSLFWWRWSVRPCPR